MQVTDNFGLIAQTQVGQYRIVLLHNNEQEPPYQVEVTGPSFTIASAVGGTSTSTDSKYAWSLGDAIELFRRVELQVFSNMARLADLMRDETGEDA